MFHNVQLTNMHINHISFLDTLCYVLSTLLLSLIQCCLVFNIYSLCWQDDALLSLESSERSGCEHIVAAMEERIASDTGIAALQACLSLDANLRLRYAKVMQHPQIAT